MCKNAAWIQVNMCSELILKSVKGHSSKSLRCQSEKGCIEFALQRSTLPIYLSTIPLCISLPLHFPTAIANIWSCTLQYCRTVTPKSISGAISPLSGTVACISLPVLSFQLISLLAHQWCCWYCCPAGKMHFLMNSLQFSGLIAANRICPLPLAHGCT